MNILSLSQQLAEKLETIGEIQAVYRCEPKNPTGFPFAMVLPAPSRNETLDSCSNSLFFAFRVSLVDDISDNDELRQGVEDRIYGIIDEIFTILSQKNAFTGVSRQIVRTGEPKYIEREGGLARLYEISIEFQILRNIL